MEKLACLNVSPKQCPGDQLLRITAENLQPRKPYTIAAVCKIPEAPNGFLAYAFYVADDIGIIDLNTTPSIGGSFIGVEPMGLIWSMDYLNDNELERNVNKFRLLESTTSYEIFFSLYTGHDKPPTTPKSFDKTNNSLIAQTVIERIFHTTNVVRVQVREGRLRGILYAPTGNGPFQGVLDISSIPPRKIFNLRALQLASHGFVAFAAGCTDYDGSPDADHLELEYFLECVEWLYSLPIVAKTGIAITALCVGGTIAFYLALFSPLVKGVVTINSCSYFTDKAMTYKGKELSKFIDLSKIKSSADGLYLDFLNVHPIIENLAVPIEKSAGDIRFLIIAGEDDHIINADHARHLSRRLEKAGRHKFKLITYPQVGHILSQPNTPFLPNCSLLYSDNKGKLVHAGGEMYSHARAQNDVWKETLKFITELSSCPKI